MSVSMPVYEKDVKYHDKLTTPKEDYEYGVGRGGIRDTQILQALHTITGIPSAAFTKPFRETLLRKARELYPKMLCSPARGLLRGWLKSVPNALHQQNHICEYQPRINLFLLDLLYTIAQEHLESENSKVMDDVVFKNAFGKDLDEIAITESSVNSVDGSESTSSDTPSSVIDSLATEADDPDEILKKELNLPDPPPEPVVVSKSDVPKASKKKNRSSKRRK